MNKEYTKELEELQDKIQEQLNKMSDDSSNMLSIEQGKRLQNTYNYKIKDLVTKDTEIKSLIDDSNSEKIAQQVLEECNIDTTELLKEGMKINECHPDTSKQDLAIELLNNIANNKKYKKMRKIAKEMLKERWWEKND